MSPIEFLLIVIICATALLWTVIWSVLLGIERAYNKMVTTINNQADLLKQLADHQVSFAKEVRLRQDLEPELSKEPPPRRRPSLRLLDPKCLDPNYDPGTEINK